MSERAGGTKEKGEGKKPHINKPTSEKWKMYKITGSVLTKKRACPRCGAGIFLAEHKERLYCGKCHYTEFTVKK